jgi:hypothetical protein
MERKLAMAFTQTPSLDRYRLVSRFDPAIDPAASDLDAYVSDYAYNPAHLTYHESAQPTVFHCKPLSQRLMARLLDRMMRGQSGGEVELSIHEAALLAFRWGVADIDNLPGFDAERDIQSGNPSAIKESFLDACCLPIDVMVEIGSTILAKARLTDTDRKN